MKVSDIDDQQPLKITDMENFFSVFEDKRGNYVYNLNETIYVDAPDSLREYRCPHTMHWPLISYKIYGTTRMAWLLLKLNNVSFRDTFKAKMPGDTVKYVDKDSLKVRDAGTYTIQYVVRYKGDNPDLKSNPEGLEVNEDASGIHVTINGEEI